MSLLDVSSPGPLGRAELRLARDPSRPLRAVPLDPDPMEVFANAVSDVRQELGEIADIRILLLAATPAKAQHERRSREKAALAGGGGSVAAQIRAELLRGTSWAPAASQARAPRRLSAAELREHVGKFDRLEPYFHLQVLVRTVSEIPGRAEAHLRQVLQAFDVFTAENWFKSSGFRLAGRRIGADFGPRARRFDTRFFSGELDVRRSSLVAASEIAGLLKPATRHCSATNVARSGGLVPLAPRTVPTYTRQPTLMPLGFTATGDGTERFIGVPLKDLLFGFILGRSGYGKTELALVQAVSLAHAGHGLFFLDPHRDGRDRAWPYLAHPHLAGRIWDVDLSGRDPASMTASWNPLSMAGRPASEAQDVIDSIVSGIASALSWGDVTNRAQTILTKAVEALTELSLHMCRAGHPELQPTLFQIPTLLSDDVWRSTVLGVLPEQSTGYWRNSFGKLPPEASVVVTNIFERMSAFPSLRAFFGSSTSTFDVRHAMDSGKIVFVCPGGNSGSIDRVVSCLLVYDLFRAGRSRAAIPREARRTFWAFVDELTAVDGAAKGHLAGIVEQLRKYEVRLLAMTQMAQRLTATTRDALMTNYSLLSSSSGEADAVKIATKQWGQLVEPETVVNLDRYHHIMSATVNGKIVGPFKVRGAEISEVFGDLHRPEDVERLDTAVNNNLARRPMGEILADQATLEERILAFLASNKPATSQGQPPAAGGATGRASGQSTELLQPGDDEQTPPGPNSHSGWKQP